MRIDRIDVVVVTCAGFLGLLLIGMLTDIWQLALYPIPLLTMALLALGSLNMDNRWGPALPPLAAFGVVLVGLFGWMGATLFGDGRLGGMQTGLGVAYYVLWPFVTIFSGLLYALIYTRWLKKDVEVATATAECPDPT